MDKEIREYFESNMLDGDKIEEHPNPMLLGVESLLDFVQDMIKDLGYVKKSELVIDETATLELFGKYSDLVIRAKQYLSYRISEASQDLIKEKKSEDLNKS